MATKEPQIIGQQRIDAALQHAANDDMARRIGSHPWHDTELGPRASWSPTLNTALELCLGSRMCGCIYWGANHLIIYNDAYASILGSKHPWALGRPAYEVWPEIFDVIGPLLKQTYHHQQTTGRGHSQSHRTNRGNAATTSRKAAGRHRHQVGLVSAKQVYRLGN